MKHLYIALLFLLFTSCKYNKVPGNSKKPIVSFKSVKGINFTEVRRDQNGIAFNEYGYRLLPQWRIKFLSNDSVALFSPAKRRFFTYPLSCGTDSVFNTNRSYLKLKKISRDSLLFELLLAKNDSLDLKGTKVLMHFYADQYITNKLHTTASALQRNNSRDSAYVLNLVMASMADITKAFAAYDPVKLISKKSTLKVDKRITVPDFLFNNYNTSDDYMNPTYYVVIHNASANFDYSFAVYVDTDGRMHYDKPLVPLPEGKYRDNYISRSQAIMKNYLQRYLTITPGNTLGMVHPSSIAMHVKGTVR